MGICFVSLLVLILFLTFTKNYRKKFGVEGFLMERFRVRNRLTEEKKKKALERIHLTKKSEDLLYHHWQKKLRMVLWVLILFFSLGSLYEWKMQKENVFPADNHLTRPAYGEQEEAYHLFVSVGAFGRKPVTVKLSAREYNREEWDEACKKAEEWLQKELLSLESGQNKQASITFPTKVPGTAIRIRWKSNEDGILDFNGSLHQDKLTVSKEIEVTAKLQSKKWSKEINFPVTVRPQLQTPEEEFWKKFYSQVGEEEKAAKTSPYFYMPNTVNGKRVDYSFQKGGDSILFFFLGILAAVLVFIKMDQEIMQKDRKRLRELQMDYPGFVNKFTLLLGAGMTINGAWERIVKDYQKRKAADRGKMRYVYEEMVITWQELRNGESEVTAYENYGRRICLKSYLKFSALISQNLRKGSRELLELLEAEASAAFEERKELAKCKGEETGTKLLLPMGLMLLIVLVIILVPAFLSF